MAAVFPGTSRVRPSRGRTASAGIGRAQAIRPAPGSRMIRLMKRLIAAISLGIFPQVVAAAGPCIQPPTVELAGPFATQRLLVVDAEGDKGVGDRTAEAAFSWSTPTVATVDAAGVVRAAADGE